MNNVIALRNRDSRSLSFLTEVEKPFYLDFFLGVAAVELLPQAVAITYYGVFMAIVLGTCASVGIGWGLASYRRSPSLIQTLSLEGSAKNSYRSELTTLKAA